MDRPFATPPGTIADPTDLARALGAERARLFMVNTRSSVLISAAVAILLAGVIVGAGRPSALPLWLAAIAGALLLRLGLARAQARAPSSRSDAGWIGLHRLSFALHGLTWCALGLWLLPANGQHALVVGSVLLAMTAGSLVTAAFDTRAALLFSVPTSAPLLARLAGLGGAAEPALLVVALLFLTMAGIVAVRLRALWLHGVSAGMAERQRAAEAESARRALADQHRLMSQLVAGTHQGYWFIDTRGATLEVNPAMCALLGRSREELLKSTVWDVFTGPERQVLERELAARREGRVGGYEVDIVRPDGSRLHAHNNATPIYGADGQLQGSIGLWTDLTGHKRLTAELSTYERVANSIADLVAVVDRDLRLCLVNDAWCRQAGVDRTAVLGRPVMEHPLQLEPGDPTAPIRACLAGGEAATVTVEALAPDGRPLRLQTRCYPYRDGGDQVHRVILVSRDVTEQEQANERLRHREAELRALFEAFPGFIGATDAQMNYVFMNRRAGELVGHDADSLIGRPVPSVLPPALVEVLRGEMARAAAGEIVLAERSYRRADDGSRRDVEVTHLAGPPGPDGRRLFYSFGLDVTAQKRALEALANARDEAERANRAKSRFLSHMSHELRTPLHAVSGFAQLLARDPQHPLSPRQQEHVAQILRGAQHLGTLIGDLLDLARIESGHMVVTASRVPLGELVAECLDFVRELAAGRRVHLLPTEWAGPGELPAVEADGTRLKQVLLNLLGNAIKYNRADGEAQVQVRTDAGEAVITVHDTGPGLSAEQQARLFQPFDRLGAEGGPIEGTGIGLVLSRHLVELMGGRIGLDSAPGRGSRFWIRLPLAATVAPAASERPMAPPPVADAQVAARRVLCVDDSPVNLALLEAMLEGVPGLQVQLAADAHSALDIARREPPDLLLLDIHMPGVDGLELLRRFRADPAFRPTPMVAVSADAQVQSIEQALAAGFDDYLTKPLELDHLLATVARCLGQPVP